MLKPDIQQIIGTADPNFPGPYDADRLQPLGAENTSEPALARGAARVMDQTGHSRPVFSGLPDGQHGRHLRCPAALAGRLGPSACVISSHNIFPDDLLALPCGRSPKGKRCTVPDFHLIIPDIYPDRVCLTHPPQRCRPIRRI